MEMSYHTRETDPIKYLENVLNKWHIFCDSHKRLASAIKFLLIENKNLKEEVIYKELQRKEDENAVGQRSVEKC